MSGNGFHVHGPHDHELEHAARKARMPGTGARRRKSMTSQIAVCTAVIATVGAIFAYMGGPHPGQRGALQEQRRHQEDRGVEPVEFLPGQEHQAGAGRIRARPGAADRQAALQTKVDRYEQEKAEILAGRPASSRKDALDWDRRPSSRCTSTTAGPRPPLRSRCRSRWLPWHC